jgi:hypothetical protein
MKINNLVFIPFAAPLALLGLFRAVWFFAGAEWSDPDFAAFAAIAFGVPLGAFFAAKLAEKGADIGHTTIGRAKE